jgi:hypothetical protein
VQKNDKSRASREFDARFLDAHRHNQISFARAPKRLRCSEFAAIIEKVVPATGTSSIIANRSPVRSSSASGFPEPPPPLSLPKFCRRLPRGVAARVGRAARFALLTLAALALPAFAHNLGQEATFLNFDRPTLDQFAARASAAQPLIKAGDTVGVVLKSTPGPGTATGAGGYMTFYVPAGVQVIGVEYVREDPAQPGTYIDYPLPGPAIMPIGSGPIGQTCPASPPYANLRGVVLGPNVLGVSEKPVTDGAGCHRGTIAGVYADIGHVLFDRPAHGCSRAGPADRSSTIVASR